MNPDVVVIGGGIVGVSCAYYLALEGLKVRLVEKGPVGSGASRAGMSHVVTWEEPEIHLKLARRSNHLYQELAQTLALEIEYRATGSLAIVESPEKIEGMRQTVERLQAWGHRCRMLSGQDLCALEPNLAPDLAGGAFFEEDAQVNPLHATRALAHAAQQLGAGIDSFTEVTGFEFSPSKEAVTAVVTDKGRIPAGAVVIAAGAWSGLVGELAGLKIPVSPRKGTLVVTVPVKQDIIRTKVMMSAGYMDAVKSGSDGGAAVAANIQQMPNGNLLLGSSRQFVGFDPAVDLKVVAMMLQRNLRFFPVLAGVTAIRTWAGFRPYTPDLLPIIAPVEQLGGMYLACGHEGIGITEGPVTGKLISQLITGQTPEINLEQLSFARFNQQ
jgi:sarcosine oxidase subunit beta